MLIFISGTDSYLARQALARLRQQYQAKNPNNLELAVLEAGDDSLTTNWADLQAVPLFSSSRLIIITGAGLLPPAEQDTLAHYLGNLPPTTVVALWDQKPLPAKSVLGQICQRAPKQISVEPLEGKALERWILGEASQRSLKLTEAQVKQLNERFGNDLWALSTELTSQALSHQQTSSWSKNPAGESLDYFRHLQAKNWRALKGALHRASRRGEPIELVVGVLAAAIRRQRQDKAWQVAATDFLSDIDLGLKLGLIEADEALSLISSRLPQPTQAAVQWERQYYETFS